MKQAVFLAVMVSLSGCGGYHKAKHQNVSRSTAVAPTVQPQAVITGGSKPYASGPIQSACLTSDRAARSSGLCGCIQAVANQSLTSSQQHQAVAFYNDPHLAQETRQSDKAADEKLWQAYKNYGDRARQVCS